MTFHNGPGRKGLNPNETVLTPNNVNRDSFGLLFNLPVDGQVYAQPLFVSQTPVFSNGQPQGNANLVIVCTENDSVYAFGAKSGRLWWKTSLLAPGETAADEVDCSDLTPQNGITGTPVIDRNAGPHGTVYVIGMSMAGGQYFYRLHALDLASGQDVLSPVTIQAVFPDPNGQGPLSNGQGLVEFSAAKERQRAGLALANGLVYVAFASFCDSPPYSGWVLAYDQATLALRWVFNSNPNGTPASTHLPDGSGGGIWQSGAAPAVGPGGNLFIATGDGPFNQQDDADGNSDFGAGGPMVLDIADDAGNVQKLVITGAKNSSSTYLLDRNNLGQFNPGDNSQIYQELPGVLGQGAFGAPAYFNGSLYFGGSGTNLKQFTFSNAQLGGPSSASPEVFRWPGPSPSVSSNGNSNGIVWAIEYTGQESPAVLHAYDATNLAIELYSSTENFGNSVKFAVPTVANGLVFLGTTSSVAVFGLFQ